MKSLILHFCERSEQHLQEITQKVAFSNFQFWQFPPIFDLLKVTCLVTLFDHMFQVFKNSPKLTIFGQLKVTSLVILFNSKLEVFKNSPKLTIFGIFTELLSTPNVNVARYARNVEWDFFCDFQTPWRIRKIFRQLFLWSSANYKVGVSCPGPAAPRLEKPPAYNMLLMVIFISDL